MGLRRPRGKFRRDEVVVDAPAGVVVEGFSPPRPPRIRTWNIAGQLARDVDPSTVEQARHPLALVRLEPGASLVRLERLEVVLRGRDVPVTADDGVAAPGFDRRYSPNSTRKRFFSSNLRASVSVAVDVRRVDRPFGRYRLATVISPNADSTSTSR